MTNQFLLLRNKAQTKAPKKTEQDFLRERFKPLNKKFSKLPSKKEKLEDDPECNRRSNAQLLSTMSDDNSGEIVEEHKPGL